MDVSATIAGIPLLSSFLRDGSLVLDGAVQREMRPSPVAACSPVSDDVARLTRERDELAEELERTLSALEIQAAVRQAAQRTTERLRSILKSALDFAIFTCDQKGRITSWSDGARHILGYDEGEILGRSVEYLFVPEGRDTGLLNADLLSATEHGRVEQERWYCRKNGEKFWASGVMVPLLKGGHAGFLSILRDQTEQRREEKLRTQLLAELNHRVKNSLASVQSLAMQTAASTKDKEEFLQAFGGRLIALARGHDLLARNGWRGATLHEIAAQMLESYLTDARVRIAGPQIQIAPQTALGLNLAFYELCTNTVRHGALSEGGGSVQLSWSELSDNSELIIDWAEQGGPPVEPRSRKGFGSRFLERGLRHEFKASVTLDFAPEGFKCHIRIPIEHPEMLVVEA